MDAKAIIDALILGVVEGVTEFIPVSSTGHLLLAGRLLGFDNAGKAFEVLIQFGAILALVSVYAGRLWHMAASLPSDRTTQRFALGVIIAFLPAAILGVTFHDFITEVLFESVTVISVTLIVGGVVLLFIDRLPIAPRHFQIMDFPLGLCLGIGLFQCLSLIPGVSRSGATIVTGLLVGLDRRAATDFSFLLALPTMYAATLYSMWKGRAALAGEMGLGMAVGLLAAYVSALIVIHAFLRFVQTNSLRPFGWYRIAAGLAVLGWLFLA